MSELASGNVVTVYRLEGRDMLKDGEATLVEPTSLVQEHGGRVFRCWAVRLVRDKHRSLFSRWIPEEGSDSIG